MGEQMLGDSTSPMEKFLSSNIRFNFMMEADGEDIEFTSLARRSGSVLCPTSFSSRWESKCDEKDDETRKTRR